MLKDLNELEKIGLAFISGLVAREVIKQEVEQEEQEEDNNDNEKEFEITVGKLEGEQAEKFKKLMKEVGVE